MKIPYTTTDTWEEDLVREHIVTARTTAMEFGGLDDEILEFVSRKFKTPKWNVQNYIDLIREDPDAPV